jgi:hypothetical protein
LFTRLRVWMGDDQRYCSQCTKFTQRLKKNKGRCEYKPYCFGTTSYYPGSTW